MLATAEGHIEHVASTWIAACSILELSAGTAACAKISKHATARLASGALTLCPHWESAGAARAMHAAPTCAVACAKHNLTHKRQRPFLHNSCTIRIAICGSFLVHRAVA